MNEQRTLPGFEDLVIEEEHITPEEAWRLSVEAQAAFELLLDDSQQKDALPLRDPYLDLVAKGWEWRKALYIAWARLPIKLRWPRTMEDLSGVMGLRSSRVIRKWRAGNPEIDRLVKDAVVGRIMERSAEILEASRECALFEGYKGFRDRQMLLEIAGVYRKQQDIALATSVVNADDMAAAQRQAEEEIAEWERERFGDLERLERAVEATLTASQEGEDDDGD